MSSCLDREWFSKSFVEGSVPFLVLRDDVVSRWRVDVLRELFEESTVRRLVSERMARELNGMWTRTRQAYGTPHLSVGDIVGLNPLGEVVQVSDELSSIGVVTRVESPTPDRIDIFVTVPRPAEHISVNFTTSIDES